MDTKQDPQKTVTQYWFARASETRQNSKHLCDEAQVIYETAQPLIGECQEIIDRIFSSRLLPFLAIGTSYVV
jgi:hypothetical protein